MLQKTTAELLKALELKEITAQDLTRASLDRIQAENDRIGAFLSIDEDGALAAAVEVDRKREAGEPLGPLAGIPVAIKDNINQKGRKTTCASKFMEDFVSPYNATVIERLQNADAILVGKTNLDEFAMGSSTEHSALMVTRNPVNTDYVPGGSSGGSAAAVAADMTPLSLGSDTGGSIRQPASFCGLVGLKPTYGLVSRYGLVAFGSSLDQIGPFSRDVDGAARLLSVIAGYDPKDATSSDREIDGFEARDLGSGLRVGLVREFMENLSPEISAAMNNVLARLKDAGADIVECSLPHAEYAVPAYYLVATAEASANLARFDGVRYSRRSPEARNLKEMYLKSRSEGFGKEVQRRILLGTYCLSSGYYEGYYLNAQKTRSRITGDFNTAFSKVDILLSPTCPSTAFRFGEKTEDPISMYQSDIFTVMANLSGIPAISLPAGKDAQGLPIGVQLMANHFEDAKLLNSARFVESLINSPVSG